MPILLQLQKLPGKAGGGRKKRVSLHHFLARRSRVRRERLKQKRFGASYGTSNKLLLVARHILTTGL